MNETLKGVAHIGAELAAAKADLQREMERHRKTWRQLEQVTGLLREAVIDFRTNDLPITANLLEERLNDAISLQAEPAPAQDEQYPPCDFCGVIPDHHPWHGSGLFNGVDSPHIHACNGCRHLLPVNPAQTEQQPVAWRIPISGVWQTFATEAEAQAEYDLCHSEDEEYGEHSPAPLYAAPIAQTTPSCNHRFMYFGDQTNRRCADCCVVEGNEQTAPQPKQSVLPLEPTEAMLDAYWEHTGESVEMRGRVHDRARRLYAAMARAALSSTPSPAKRGEA